MRRSRLSACRFLIVTFFLVLVLGSLSAQFAGGEGTEDSPWQVETAEHLNNVRNYLGVQHTNKHFRQTANIDLDEAPWNEGVGWHPIGVEDNHFMGSYDGGRFIIANLRIERFQIANDQGLFGFATDAEFKNIGLTNVFVRGSSVIGSLAATVRNSTIKNCYVDGGQLQSSSFYLGGLVSRLINSTLDGCYSNVTVRGRFYSGGLVETASQGSVISNSYSNSTVYGNGVAAVLVGGLNPDSRVVNSYVVGDFHWLGGSESYGALVGGTAQGVPIGEVVSSYWNIETAGITRSAGGTRKITTEMISAETFEEWDFEDVWAIEEGESYPYLRWQTEAGEHNYPTFLPPGNIRGVAANNQIHLSWDAPTIGEPDGYNVYSGDNLLTSVDGDVTEANLQQLNNYTAYSLSVAAVYDETESRSGTLTLIPFPGFAGGTGTEEDPYLIETAVQLKDIAVFDDNKYRFKHFLQTDDIDLSVLQLWTPIGELANEWWMPVTAFTGNFDGDGHTISNLNIASNQALLGLFGYIEGARLSNINLTNIEISGMGLYKGGLVARTDVHSSQNDAGRSVIENCFVSGEITSGANYTGGLIGATSMTEILSSSANVTINTTGTYQGGLVAYLSGSSYIKDSWASGNVTTTTAEASSFTGGLVGWTDASDSISGSFAYGNVSSNTNYVGGLIGESRTNIVNCFAMGNVHGTRYVGGLVGNQASRSITDSYSAGRVSSPEEQDIGGLLGANDGEAEGCYWNTETSGRNDSAGGEGRLTRQMTHPIDAQTTYTDWDFEEIWVNDESFEQGAFPGVNNGYPYPSWYTVEVSPNPSAATNPAPEHQATDVPADLEELTWTYTVSNLFTNPVGFRVYMGTTDEFADDDFVWIDYVDEQENYAAADILPEQIDYNTTYYWKVVPTTIHPDGRSGGRIRRNSQLTTRHSQLTIRGDAEHVPVWSFTAELNPNPKTSVNPQPADEATDVSTDLERLSWQYIVDESHTNPLGFRVYFNTTGEFGDEDEFVWVPYVQNQTNYSSTDLLPEELDYRTDYYWKVVPTTINPDQRFDGRNRRHSQLTTRHSQLTARGDAEDVPVWTFSTLEFSPNPKIAENPNPEHLATGVSLGLNSVSWDYIEDEIYTDPVGFRVYMNTTGAFGSNAPYVWVDFEEDRQTYISSEIVPDYLDENTTYYWRVIPTTNHPDDDRRSSLDEERRGDKLSHVRRRADSVERSINSVERGDAQHVPTWRLTTGTTDAEETTTTPLVTELIGNYPNPFNPETIVSFSLAAAGEVSLTIYNNRGQKIVNLYDGHLEAGRHSVIWDGSDKNENKVSSGIYFLTMEIEGNYRQSQKMMMLK